MPALVISHLCGSAAYHGLTTRQIALFEDNSVNGETAVRIAAVAGLVVFVWRLLSGWLCDLRGSGPVMSLAAPAGLLTFATLVAILVTANVAALFVYPLVLGVAFGGQQVLLANRVRLLALSALSASAGSPPVQAWPRGRSSPAPCMTLRAATVSRPRSSPALPCCTSPLAAIRRRRHGRGRECAARPTFSKLPDR